MKIFVSYTSRDRDWAQWIGWNLRESGHEAFVHEWEVGAGDNIPRWMEDRLGQADKLLGVFSDAYCDALYSQSERWAAYWQDPGGRSGFLVPVEVIKVTTWPVFIDPLKRLSLVDLDESEALKRLVAFLEPPRPPSEKPTFPGGARGTEPPSTPFTEGGEALDSRPPSFPVSRADEDDAQSASEASPPLGPDTAVRCIDDYVPRQTIFGRDREVETIIAGLLAGKTVLIAGGPGMGKTAVATAALHDPRVETRFGRRRVFAALESATEPRAILVKLVETLGLHPTGDEVTLLRILEANAAERSIAAILDNAETVFDANRKEAERLLALAAQIEGLSLAVTIRGVPPPLPDAISIDDLPKLTPQAARRAFIAVAGPSFEADPDLPHLLEGLDGHALSVRLVAAQAIGLPSLQGLRESWDEAHAEILRGPGEEEGRLTSVRASLSLSLSSRRMKSTPLSRRLLALLAFLPGGLPESDVQSLLGERGTLTKAKANDAIGCLHQLRLVERRLDRRLRMLTPLRESVKDEVQIMEIDRRRLVEHYLTLAMKSGEIGERDWDQFREQVESESDNIDPICVLAVASNISQKRVNDAIRRLSKFYQFSGRGAIECLNHATARLRGNPPSLAEANLVEAKGDVALSRADYEAARLCFDEALALYHYLENVRGQAHCIFGLGQCEFRQSNRERAYARVAEGLALYRRIGHVLGQANCIHCLGDILLDTDNSDAAEIRFEEALALYHRVGDLLGQAHCISSLGAIAFVRSDLETAHAHFDKALTLYRSLGQVSGEANALVSIGQIAFVRCEHELARASFVEAMASHRRLGIVAGEADCLFIFGQIALAEFDYGAAHRCLDEALVLKRRVGDTRGQARCMHVLSMVALLRSEYGQACAGFEEALLFHRKGGDKLWEAEAMVRLGQARRAADNLVTGLCEIESGFSLYFRTADPKNRALSGWQAMHRALTCEDTTEAKQHRELARSAWTAIGRLDLVREWVDQAI